MINLIWIAIMIFVFVTYEAVLSRSFTKISLAKANWLIGGFLPP